MPRSIAPACSAVSRRCRMSVSRRCRRAGQAGGRAGLRGLISTLSISAFRLGERARASTHHCNVKAVFPGPRRPADESDQSRPDLDPRKLAGADRIEGRRLAR